MLVDIPGHLKPKNFLIRAAEGQLLQMDQILASNSFIKIEHKFGQNRDHFGTLVPCGTKSQIWDLIGAPE